MSTSLTASLGQTIRLQGDFSHILNLWQQIYQNEPLVTLREYIANISIKPSEADYRPVYIDYSQDTVSIFDSAYGLYKDILYDVNARTEGEVQTCDTFLFNREIDCSSLSAFVLANRIEITSSTTDDHKASRLVWVKGKSHMQIFNAETKRSGNQIRLYLKERFLHLANPYIIRAYIARIFGLFRRPINVRDIDEVINPAYYWLEGSVRQAVNQKKTQTELLDPAQSQNLLQLYFPAHRPAAPFVATEPDGSRVILSIPENPELDAKPQLFRNGVLIGESEFHLLPVAFRFIKVLVDSPHFQLSDTHDKVIQNDSTLLELSHILRRQVYDYFSLLANEQPQLLTTLLKKYRESLLPYAIRNLNWKDFLVHHYPLYCAEGFTNWYDVSQSLRTKSCQARLALFNTTAPSLEDYDSVLISNEDVEREFIYLLASDTQILLEEPDQNDAKEKENIALELYCRSLISTVAQQLRILGVDEAAVKQLSSISAQITQNR